MSIINDIYNFFVVADVVIVDIDNTILRNGIYPIKKMIDYVNNLAKDHKIYLITGRPESKRDETVDSLKKAGVKYNRLMMNNLGGGKQDQIESKKKHAESIKDKILFAIDDNPKMRNAYQKIGIKTKSPKS